MNRVNYIGRVFGRLRAVSNSYIDSKGYRVIDVQCSCGVMKPITISSIDRVKSCGCYLKEKSRVRMKDKNKSYREVWYDMDKPSKHNKGLGIKNIYQKDNGVYEVTIIRDGSRFRKCFKTLEDAIKAKKKFLKEYKEIKQRDI